MAEEKAFKDNKELNLNDENGVLRPPPRRKKSMKKTKMDAEKSRQNIRRVSTQSDVGITEEKTITQASEFIAPASTKDSVDVEPIIKSNVESSNDVVNSIERECTNDISPDSKVKAKSRFDTIGKMATDNDTLSINSKRNMHLNSDDHDLGDMGNSKSSTKSKPHSSTANSNDSGIISGNVKEDSCNVDVAITENVETFCWVDVSADSVEMPKQSSPEERKSSTNIDSTEVKHAGVTQSVVESNNSYNEQRLHGENITNDVKVPVKDDGSDDLCTEVTVEGNNGFKNPNSEADNVKFNNEISLQDNSSTSLENNVSSSSPTINEADQQNTSNLETQEALNTSTLEPHLSPSTITTQNTDTVEKKSDNNHVCSVPYQTLDENMTSEGVCEKWETDNISMDSDTDSDVIFYSDWSSSDEGESKYDIELAEKMYGVSSTSSDQNSLPRGPSGNDPVTEILSAFPDTEYLTVTDDKREDLNSNHGDGNLGNGSQGDLDLTEDRAQSLKRKIGSFKVVKPVDHVVGNDVVKEAAVAIPTDSYKVNTDISNDTNEAEKAIEALHQEFLKHVQRDSKSDPWVSPKREGESAVYFKRAPPSKQDSDSSRMNTDLEISRPRSIHGEPRLRSLSAGDIRTGLRYSPPMRATSWKDENEQRLTSLHMNLSNIIGSLGRLEDSHERRDSGSPLFSHIHKTKKVGLIKMPEEISGKVRTVEQTESNPCAAEERTSGAFEEHASPSGQTITGDIQLDKDSVRNRSHVMRGDSETGPGECNISDEDTSDVFEQEPRHSAQPPPVESLSGDVEEKGLTIEKSPDIKFLSVDPDLGPSDRPLSIVPEESPTVSSSSRGSSFSQEGKPQADAPQIKEDKCEHSKTEVENTALIHTDDSVESEDMFVGLEATSFKPVNESTPRRPQNLELTKPADNTSIETLTSTDADLSRTPQISQCDVGKKDIKDTPQNVPENEVKLRKIKMAKGRRPFSAVEPRNIPSSPTEKNVQLRSFRSHIDGFTVDAVDSCEPAESSPSNDIEEAEEVIEESSPKRPPRTKGKLIHSASFASTPSREKVVKRPKNTKIRSRWQTLSEADWLRVSFSTKPALDLVHEGPVTLVTDALPASIPNFPTYKRAQVALELYTTERTYVRGLETVIELFKTPLEGYLDSKEMEAMFCNISAIYQLNKDVLFTLCEKVTHWNDDQIIGSVFVDMAPRFRIYASYCTNYEAADNLIKQKIKRKKDFENFLNSCYNDPVCEPGITLPAYLVTVVQRIPRYILLLKDLDRYTPAHHPDKHTIKEGLQKMINIAEYLNNQVQNVHGVRAMSELRSRFIGIEAFETPGRPLVLIKEGEVYLISTKKPYTCLLVSDWILFAARNVKKHKEVLELGLELKTLWVCDLHDNDPQTNKDDAIEVYTPERCYTMYAGSRNEKKHWLQKIKTAIAIQLHGDEATDNSQIATRKAGFTFKDGRIYCGCFVDSKMHGYGVLAWPNRTRYDGDFEDGERNGAGELTYNTGEKYKGEWKDDKQHGNGTLTYPNGDVYTGQWMEGKMHGKGLIKFNNNDVLNGEFIDSEVCGRARLECSNNLFYEGTWKHSKKHGKGKLIKPNGDTYEGEFHNDRIHGQGKMFYAKTKATYDGQWENNHRHGTGKYSYPNGDLYEGEWSSDHIQGWGKMVYGNGEVYEGSWFRDMHFGKGDFKTHEGFYVGHFEYNLRHKFGLMQYKDGSEYEGEWQNDQREGQGKMIYADSGIYEGYWFHNLRHGRGKMSYPNGATYEGTWDLDSPHGSDGVYLDQASNYSYEGEWVHGRKEGRGVQKTASCTYEGDFKADMRHGKGTETLKGGIVFEGKWRDNRKVGEGIKRTKWGNNETTEIQQWKEGQLFNKDESVAPDLPFLQRH